MSSRSRTQTAPSTNGRLWAMGSVLLIGAAAAAFFSGAFAAGFSAGFASVGFGFSGFGLAVGTGTLSGSGISSAWASSGFGSLSAFNKSFRKIAGMSPSDFRSQARLRPAVN